MSERKIAVVVGTLYFGVPLVFFVLFFCSGALVASSNQVLVNAAVLAVVMAPFLALMCTWFRQRNRWERGRSV